MLDGREIKRTSYLGQTKARRLRNFMALGFVAWTAAIYGGALYYTRSTSKTSRDNPFLKINERLVPDNLKQAYLKDQERRLAEILDIQERRAAIVDRRKHEKC